MIPGVVLYVYFGSVANDIKQIIEGEKATTSTQKILYIVGFVVTILLFIFVSIISTRALKKEIRKQEEDQSSIEKAAKSVEKSYLLSSTSGV